MEQKEIRRYLKKVKRYCPYPFRKKLMPELEGNLLDFLDENPDSTIADVEEHFGAPETFGYAYILAMEDEERRRLVKQSRRVKVVALAVTVVCVIAMAAWVAWSIWWHEEHAIRSYEVWIEYDNTGEIERVIE